jgi:hypothetical protein
LGEKGTATLSVSQVLELAWFFESKWWLSPFSSKAEVAVFVSAHGSVAA